jgi:ribosomal protein L29
MAAHELDEMTGTDLEAKLREAKEELFNLRFQAATGSWRATVGSARSRRTLPGSTRSSASASSGSVRRRAQTMRMVPHERADR